MPKVRTICCNNKEKNYYIIDACFLFNKYIPTRLIPSKEKDALERISKCHEWWKIIEDQLNKNKAIIYIPDICIAEVIKIFARKLYQEKSWFKNKQQHNYYLKKFTTDIQMTHQDLKRKNRIIKYHDISTSRDILISIERFISIFLNNGLSSVSIPDLIILATTKYLMDFYDLPYSKVHIITMDKKLLAGSKKITEIPSAYDPTLPQHAAKKIFRNNTTT